MTTDTASFDLIAGWPLKQQNCLPLHISNNISAYIKKKKGKKEEDGIRLTGKPGLFMVAI